MAETELELTREGAVVRVIRVGAAPVHLGRQLDNTVVLLDEDVSGHHAVVVAAPDGLRVTDLRSTNGTWRNGARVVGEAVLEDGDELRLGGSCVLRVREVPEPRGVALALADLTAGTVHPLSSARVRIGSGPGCHV
ncbi:MAG: FHA domain-containing protein, partial [Myxococcota bacterium]